MKLLSLLFLFLNCSAGLLAQRDFNLILYSDNWKTKNEVVFGFKSDTSISISKRVYNHIKRNLSGHKMKVNQGFIKSSIDGIYVWYFDRDSVIRFQNGNLVLLYENKVNGNSRMDTLSLKLPKVIKVIPDLTVFSNSHYFSDVFDNKVTLCLDNGDTVSDYTNFQNESSIFGSIKIEGDVHNRNDFENKYWINYSSDLEDFQINFVDKYTDRLINSFLLPKTIYIQQFTFNSSGKTGLNGENGVHGIRQYSKIGEATPEISSLKLNGTDGFNGYNGENASSVVFKIERLRNKENMARITVSSIDTSRIYYVDLVNGGSFYLETKGGKGGDGGDAGSCGHIVVGDKTIKEGMAGAGGVGGNGGNGADVTLLIDSFFYNYYMNSILINNIGGLKGFGGYQPPKDRCYYTSPYNRSSQNSTNYPLVVDVILATHGIGGKSDNISKSESSYDLATNGKNGKDGEIKIILLPSTLYHD